MRTRVLVVELQVLSNYGGGIVKIKTLKDLGKKSYFYVDDDGYNTNFKSMKEFENFIKKECGWCEWIENSKSFKDSLYVSFTNVSFGLPYNYYTKIKNDIGSINKEIKKYDEMMEHRFDA
jgi:hypothetical protein